MNCVRVLSAPSLGDRVATAREAIDAGHEALPQQRPLHAAPDARSSPLAGVSPSAASRPYSKRGAVRVRTITDINRWRGFDPDHNRSAPRIRASIVARMSARGRRVLSPVPSGGDGAGRPGVEWSLRTSRSKADWSSGRAQFHLLLGARHRFKQECRLPHIPVGAATTAIEEALEVEDEARQARSS